MYLVILIFTLLVYLIWRFGTRNFGYWKKKGITHIKPVFFFGNMYEQFTRQLSLSQQIEKWYKMFPEEKYVGVHMANNVGLVLRDPELIKHVLVTDFEHFSSRGVNSHKDVKELLSLNMFAADGDFWKLMRQKLTPAFSNTKVKAMFPLIVKTADKMLSVTEPGTHDVKELIARYVTDIIGACGFGLELDSLTDEASQFRRLGKRFFEIKIRDTLAHIAKRTAPELFKHVNYFDPEIEREMILVVKDVLNNRNYVPSGRNDYIDFLLDIKQKGKIVGESIEHFNPDGTAKIVEIELDDRLIALQAFMFFAGTYHNTSSAGSFLLHELAFNPEEQERCLNEIDEVLSRHGGKFSYEAVKEMKFLEMAHRETMRLHSSPGYLIRKCVKKYTFPGTDLTIDEGVYVLVSLQAMHNDPRLVENPERFKPDRFLAGEVGKLQKYGYLPFGAGPRACSGERLGLTESMTGVAKLLSRFRLEPAPTSRRRPLIDPRSYLVENVQGDLPLKLVRRQEN